MRHTHSLQNSSQNVSFERMRTPKLGKLLLLLLLLCVCVCVCVCVYVCVCVCVCVYVCVCSRTNEISQVERFFLKKKSWSGMVNMFMVSPKYKRWLD